MARPQEMPRLEPEQQKLLLAALNSQRQKDQASREQKDTASIDPAALNPFAADQSLASITFDDDLTFGGPREPNSTFDHLYSKEADDFTVPYQELDGEAGREKRDRPEDDDEDGEGEGEDGEGGSERAAKKPGRKLLTNEPTTKRKAQNRAAQRAFRERKEKHLKDLETKVSDLEQASEAANHENGILRAQIERLTTEVREYRKRASLNGSVNSSPPRLDAFSPQNVSGLDFNFDVPRFGGLPGSTLPRGASTQQGNRANSWDAARNHALSNGASNGNSPLNGTPHHANTFSSFSNRNQQDTLGGIFSPKDLDSLGDFGLGRQTTGSPASLLNGRASSYSSKQSHTSPSNSGSAGSPPSSLNTGGESACTSPDSIDTWANNYTNNAAGFGDKSKQTSQNSNTDSGFDWLNLAEGSEFDPLLFGNYREPQEAVVGNGGDFSSGFFDDNLGSGMFDMNDPFFNLTTDTTIPAAVQAPSPAQMQQQNGGTNQKEASSLMDQVLKQRDGDDSGAQAMRGADGSSNTKELMTCHKIWNQLQNCPQFKSGEFDIDSLCSELASKARCTETGVAVPKHYVEQALWRLANPEQNGSGGSSTSQPDASSSQGKGGLSAMFPNLA